MNINRASVAGVIAALTVGGMLTGPAAVAVPAPIEQRSATGHQARRLLDFAAQGVVIWNEPRRGSTQNGLGYAGQGFETDREEEHELYRCDNGQSTRWHHGRNVTTGVVGWVPACNLADPD